jgi:hypothetical protein
VKLKIGRGEVLWDAGSPKKYVPHMKRHDWVLNPELQVHCGAIWLGHYTSRPAHWSLLAGHKPKLLWLCMGADEIGIVRVEENANGNTITG